MNSESSFIAAVHKGLRCYVWKIHTTMRRDKLDSLYCGTNNLWIEYKFLPPNRQTIELSKKPFLTKLQQHEVKNLVKNKQHVKIIVGTPQGGYIFNPDQIHTKFTIDMLTLHPVVEIQTLINNLTNPQ